MTVCTGRMSIYAVEFHLHGLYKSHTNAIYGTRDWTQKSLRAARTIGPNRSIAKPRYEKATMHIHLFIFIYLFSVRFPCKKIISFRGHKEGYLFIIGLAPPPLVLPRT